MSDDNYSDGARLRWAIGIDPGVSGAICAVREDGACVVEDMPVSKVGKKQQVMPTELAKMLNAFPEGPVYIEQVHAMPKQGVASSFNFGRSFGLTEGVAAADGRQVHMVQPRAWKKKFHLIGKDKDEARIVAARLYPSASLARKKDIGRADALLIAQFGLVSEMGEAA